jgi:hypothetical protein
LELDLDVNDPIEEVAAKVLEPKEITKEVVLRALRRSKRLGIYWRYLDPLERAVLEVASRTKIDVFRGKAVKKALARVIAKVEMCTTKGSIIKLGLRYALSRGLIPLKGNLRDLLHLVKVKMGYIKYLGRSLLEVSGYFLRPLV